MFRKFSKIFSMMLAIAIFLLAGPAESQSDLNIRILRTSENTGSVTGELYVNGKFIAHTLELPWQNNKSYISSIPSGSYKAIVRYDKSDQWRLQLEGVPYRSGVQIHVGNYPSQIEGCVLVGNQVKNAADSVSDSSLAYSELRRAFYGTDTPTSSPNVVVNVTVDYSVGRTEFSGSNVTLRYQDRGRWEVTGDGEHYLFSERYRDKSYIFLDGSANGEATYLRVPLFGGAVNLADSPNGPWGEVDSSPVSRRN